MNTFALSHTRCLHASGSGPLSQTTSLLMLFEWDNDNYDDYILIIILVLW